MLLFCYSLLLAHIVAQNINLTMYPTVALKIGTEAAQLSTMLCTSGTGLLTGLGTYIAYQHKRKPGSCNNTKKGRIITTTGVTAATGFGAYMAIEGLLALFEKIPENVKIAIQIFVTLLSVLSAGWLMHQRDGDDEFRRAEGRLPHSHSRFNYGFLGLQAGRPDDVIDEVHNLLLDGDVQDAKIEMWEMDSKAVSGWAP